MRQKGFVPIILIFVIFLLLCAVFFLSVKYVFNKSVSQISPVPQNNNYEIYTDNAKIYHLEIPKNFIPNLQSRDLTDSCVVLADYTFVQPGASEEQMKELRDKGVLISVCYTAENLGEITDKIDTSQKRYSVTSSTHTVINGYEAFVVNAKSSDSTVGDMVVIKSPYQGYVVINREENGKEIYDNLLKSFKFIKPVSKVFTTADKEAIRKLFATQYKKDISVTFGFPSADQNSVSGWAYLPEGQKCFSANRKSDSWMLTYIGTSSTDSKCDN